MLFHIPVNVHFNGFDQWIQYDIVLINKTTHNGTDVEKRLVVFQLSQNQITNHSSYDAASTAAGYSVCRFEVFLFSCQSYVLMSCGSAFWWAIVGKRRYTFLGGILFASWIIHFLAKVRENRSQYVESAAAGSGSTLFLLLKTLCAVKLIALFAQATWRVFVDFIKK